MRTRIDVLLSSRVSCLTADEIVALACGRVDGTPLEQATAHLDECDTCRELVVAAAQDDGVQPGRGDAVGRYLVLGPIGAGAMGVVLEAYDPELDRKVAIKLLRAEHVGRGDDARLQTEARALARLSHPNVVTVYDVGRLGDELFIAMELVSPRTLAAWLREAPRTWTDVLDVLLAVGEGLAAAHAAGVIHRDLKPDNVLVPPDGRPRVTDFGLARSDPPAKTGAIGGRTDLTRTGAITGTPMYMAPELLDGARADERSDVYAFAVSAYEALFGQRPFAGDTIEALASAIRRGPLASTTSSVPAAVRAVVVRGLATDPNARWDSMRAMLDALLRARPQRLRTWRIAGAAVVSGGLAALLGGALLAEREQPCTAGAPTIAPLWDDARRDALHDAFTGAPPDRAAAAFATVDARLTSWTRAWAEGHDDACAATHVRGVQSPELLDARGRCLERARVETGALVDAIIDAGAVDRAATVIEEVPDLGLCANLDAIDRARAQAPTDPEARARHDAIERRFAAIAARASLDLPAHDDYVEILDEAVTAGFVGLAARIGARLGLATESHSEALVCYGDAAARAFTAGDDDSLARAWMGIAEVAGRQSRMRDAELAAKQADAAITRLGDPAELRALWHHKRCIAYTNVGQLDEALATCRDAVEAERAATGDGARLADAELSLAIVQHWRADEATALAGMQGAAERYARIVGPGHSLVDNALANVAEVQIVLGEHAEASAVLRELVARRPDWLHLRDGLAAALRAGGNHAAALREGETMLAMCEKAGCPFWIYIGLGEDRLALGDTDGASADFERARAAGADMPAFDHARVLLGLAETSKDPAVARALANDAATTIASWADRFGGRYTALRERALAISARSLGGGG